MRAWPVWRDARLAHGKVMTWSECCLNWENQKIPWIPESSVGHPVRNRCWRDWKSTRCLDIQTVHLKTLCLPVRYLTTLRHTSSWLCFSPAPRGFPGGGRHLRTLLLEHGIREGLRLGYPIAFRPTTGSRVRTARSAKVSSNSTLDTVSTLISGTTSRL